MSKSITVGTIAEYVGGILAGDPDCLVTGS
jgi:hypothetical protein